MSLIGVLGGKGLNKCIIAMAAKNTPSLIIDCANAADPHSLFPDVELEKMGQIYVIELELLYKFRDVLLRVPAIAKQRGIKMIAITTSDHLFNYQDERENNNIIEHSWLLMRKIGQSYPVIVGISEGSVHMKFAMKYCHKLGVERNGTHSCKPAHHDRHHN